MSGNQKLGPTVGHGEYGCDGIGSGVAASAAVTAETGAATGAGASGSSQLDGSNGIVARSNPAREYDANTIVRPSGETSGSNAPSSTFVTCRTFPVADSQAYRLKIPPRSEAKRRKRPSGVQEGPVSSASSSVIRSTRPSCHTAMSRRPL